MATEPGRIGETVLADLREWTWDADAPGVTVRGSGPMVFDTRPLLAQLLNVNIGDRAMLGELEVVITGFTDDGIEFGQPPAGIATENE